MHHRTWKSLRANSWRPGCEKLFSGNWCKLNFSLQWRTNRRKRITGLDPAFSTYSQVSRRVDDSNMATFSRTQNLLSLQPMPNFMLNTTAQLKSIAILTEGHSGEAVQLVVNLSHQTSSLVCQSTHVSRATYALGKQTKGATHKHNIISYNVKNDCDIARQQWQWTNKMKPRNLAWEAADEAFSLVGDFLAWLPCDDIWNHWRTIQHPVSHSGSKHCLAMFITFDLRINHESLAPVCVWSLIFAWSHSLSLPRRLCFGSTWFFGKIIIAKNI